MRFQAALILAAAIVGPACAQPVKTGHLTAELVSDKASIAPGETIHVALRQDIQKGWHTYWRNPGDSGEATQIKWTLPSGWTAGPFVWPTPHRQPTGPLVNYGYTGEVLLPMALTAPATARPTGAPPRSWRSSSRHSPRRSRSRWRSISTRRSCSSPG